MLKTALAPTTSVHRHSSYNRIPASTYRLQLSKSLDFGAVEQIIDYLDELGISDLYLSPLFRSRDASAHGYDVVSHSEVERAFGGMEAFQHLAESAQARGMGILLDVVPNHMGINDASNELWWDVLENGPNSRYAHYFDIEWNPPTAGLKQKLLLPFLGDPFGIALERGELQIVYESERFQLAYGAKRYPLSPKTWHIVLALALEISAAEIESDEALDEIASISRQSSNLPNTTADEDTSQELYREQFIVRRRLRDLMLGSERASNAVHRALNELNGTVGQPKSFDRLEALLNNQSYRLAYWRVAADEINYRRFFDINDLVAIRVESSDVFAHVHSLVSDLLRENRITGLRIDHPDGLFDPEAYFNRLQRLYQGIRTEQVAPPVPNERLYIVAEKILSGPEELPSSWAIAGTTGYEALNKISQVLVDDKGLEALTSFFGEWTKSPDLPADVVYKCKLEVLDTSMSSELQMLTCQLHRIAQQSRASKDFTFLSLRQALREVIACFPVYRTYARQNAWHLNADDQQYIRAAIGEAKHRNPAISCTAFDFIGSVLLLEIPKSTDKQQREQSRNFLLKFQQITGPVTAKGVEDTSFYRYFPLASLNEVGGELAPRTLDVRAFHVAMEHRASDWPHALSATATHDTKRGEDMRARLHVLSEIPEQWIVSFQRWDDMSWKVQQRLENTQRPSRAARYLLFQTIIGTWPEGGSLNLAWTEYTKRILRYFLKALREAKLETSWLNPNSDYESAALGYARNVLSAAASTALLKDIDTFVTSIADAGYINSLSQLVLKACMPGVPDFYQGTELWDYSLVDPDNRQPVDFPLRQAALRDLKSKFKTDAPTCVNDLMATWPDSRIKLFAAWRLLQLRRKHGDVFEAGRYLPLSVSGPLHRHVLAFVRTTESESAIVIVPRLVQKLCSSGALWQISNATVELPPLVGTKFVNAFTNEVVRNASSRVHSIATFGSLGSLPIAVLIST